MTMGYSALLLAEIPRGSLLRQITLQSIFVAFLIAVGGILLIRYVSRRTDAFEHTQPRSSLLSQMD